MQIFVLGSPRSGFSVASRILEMMGASPVAAEPRSPPSAQHVCVVLFRNPVHTARSLQIHRGLPRHVGLAIWERDTAGALHASRETRRALLSYDALVSRPMPTVKRLHEALEAAGVDGLRLPGADEVGKFIDQTPRPGGEDDDAESLTGAQQTLWHALEAGTGLDLSPSGGCLDTLAGYEAQLGELVATRQRLETALERVSSVESALRALQRERDRLDRAHRAVVGSRGWKAVLLLRRLRGPTASPSRSPSDPTDATETVAVPGRPSKPRRDPRPSVAVLAGDVFGTHADAAGALAKRLSRDSRVYLLGFDFSGTTVVKEHLAGVERIVLPGRLFPAWTHDLAAAVARVRGDMLHVVASDLSSLGVALFVNDHLGTPIVLEPTAQCAPSPTPLSELDPADPRLLDPMGASWSAILAGLAAEVSEGPVPGTLPVARAFSEFFSSFYASLPHRGSSPLTQRRSA